MQNHSTRAPHGRSDRAIRMSVLGAAMVAMSIVCGKYLAFNMGTMIRISFENLPILLAGFLLGPLLGMTVGVVADLLGCLLVGYTVNPLVTLGAAAVGLCGGLVWKLSERLPRGLRTALAVLIAHGIGSVLIKTFGLAVFYEAPLGILMLWRALNYLIVGIPEGILLYLITKNQGIRAVAQKYQKEREEQWIMKRH